MIAASRPSTRPSASINSHFLSISDGLAEKVFIALTGLRGGPDCFRSAKGGHVGDWPDAVKRSFLAGARAKGQHDQDASQDEAGDDGDAKGGRECSGSSGGIGWRGSAPDPQ